MTSNGSTDAFHLACPYTSLPVCYCSHYVPPVPNYVWSLADETVGPSSEPEPDSSSLLRGIIQEASAPAAHDAPPCPSAYELLVAQAVASAPPPPEEELALVLARAMHATPPLPVAGGQAVPPCFSAPPAAVPPGSSPALLRMENMLAAEWRQASGLHPEIVRAKRGRGKPRKVPAS